MLPVVAIVGRPNVGKSTLFNRLTGSKKALVHDRPGVTRDRNYETAAWLDRSYLLIDTGGYDPHPDDALHAQMRRQSEVAMEEADVVIFLVDRLTGVTPPDLDTAQLIRRLRRPVIVAVNKCDHESHDDEIHNFWELGFDTIVGVSAEHGRGIYDLMELVMATLPTEEAPAEEAEGEIRVAVLGQPNVGKSTLLNQLIGEDRHIVDDNPGTTVDATDSVLDALGTRFRLVDTAGIRRRARIHDRVEEIAVSSAIRTIERCHVVMLVLDGTRPPAEQDARLAGLIAERGRAIVVLVNKWDKVRQEAAATGEERTAQGVEEEVAWRLPHTTHAPLLFISAATGKGCRRILPAVKDVYEAFDKRIPTSQLNQFLRAAIGAYSPPQLHNHPVRINYMTQVRVRPPTFTVFCNNPEGLVDGYDRYLQNRLRETFGFLGTPLKMQYRKKRRLGEAAMVGEGAVGEGALGGEGEE